MAELTAILPFIPGGKDFETSRAFFKALGFEETFATAGLVGLRCGAVRFFLQDFDAPGFASNLMMTIETPDLDAWWAETERKNLAATFPDVLFKPPHDFPWGREVHFIDPAGVCWHVRTQRS